MAETNKSKLMSEAEIIEAINSDSLVSVSLGAGQPQKNVKMSTLASVVAGKIQYRRYRYVSENNKYFLEVDLNGLGWDNGLPKKWELYGGQWNQKPICYASGICRLYGSGLDNVLITSKSSIEPTASITSNGYLHVEFGTQLSYARLYVYYDL